MTLLGDKTVSMTDEEFILIRDLLFGHCGVFIPESLKFLVERRLQARVQVLGLSSFRDYYRTIKYSREHSGEFDEIVERLTTNETYFFREAYQLKSFTEEILPVLVADRRPDDRIRIWSAGCSTGEEPYTIAMLVDETPWAAAFQWEIFGNDISRKVLRSARAGLYRRSSFRQTEPRYLERYFVRQGDAFLLRPEIRNRVTFGHLNLMDEGAMTLVGNMDVIFCRNVMIYFSAESRSRLIEVFHRKLRPGGFLLLGHSESLVHLSTDFELVPMRSDVVYRKPLRDSLDRTRNR